MMTTTPHRSFYEAGRPGPRCGLSESDEASLRAERANFLEQLASTRTGRGVLRRCHPHIDMTARALRLTIEDLASEMHSPDSGRATAAVAAVWDVHEATRTAASSEFYQPYTRPFRAARSVHALMDRKLRFGRGHDEHPRQRRLAYLWGWVGNGVSGVAAVAMLMGNLTLAGIMIAIRICVTAVCWSLIGYPGDDSPDKPVLDSDPRVCVLGHASDMTLMGTVSLYLMDHGHWTAGALVWGASTAMILGTVFRIASRAPRLHLERMMRGGSICASIFLLAWSWEAAAAGIMVGPIGFALIEAMEAWKAMSDGGSGPRATIHAVVTPDIDRADPGVTGDKDPWLAGVD